MIPPLQSLVKYDNAVQVSTGRDKKKGASGKKSLPPVENKGLTQTEDILNSILPPREWTHEGQIWVQHVSSTPQRAFVESCSSKYPIDVLNKLDCHLKKYTDQLKNQLDSYLSTGKKAPAVVSTPEVKATA